MYCGWGFNKMNYTKSDMFRGIGLVLLWALGFIITAYLIRNDSLLVHNIVLLTYGIVGLGMFVSGKIVGSRIADNVEYTNMEKE